MNKSITYIVIVNWKGWQDTLECLESLFRMNGSFKVIVCDNGSNDDSLARIREWAEGGREVNPTLSAMSAYSSPAVAKPLDWRLIDRAQADNLSGSSCPQLLLVDCQENLGFAGGNNVGLQIALGQPDMRWAWLLNNDTVVDKSALQALLQKATDSQDTGIVGSTIRYYHQPNRVQAFGGARYFPMIGRAMHIGRIRSTYRPVDEAGIEKQLDYVMGASMFVSRQFLETVGLMTEDYFLYYEEIDWALRSKHRYRMRYAQDSFVFHKSGASAGSSNWSSSRSALSDYYLVKSRLTFTRRFYPHYILSVKGYLLVEAMIRVLHGQQERASKIWSMVLNRT